MMLVVPITVHSAANVPPKMVARAIAEAGAIWREVGVQLEWHSDHDWVIPLLDVEFGDLPGRREHGALDVPLAWIGFLNNVPGDEIYVSRANAYELLTAISSHSEMPVRGVNEYLGRALGRALAHEIGHWLFKSAAHDSAGVMATRRSTTAFFDLDSRAFRLTIDERTRLAAVLQGNRVAEGAASPLN